MNKLVFITLFTLCSFALFPAQAGTVDLLSIWAVDKNKKPGGVDEDGDGTIDQGKVCWKKRMSIAQSV